MTVTIRDALRADLRAIVAIERESFTDAWTTTMFATHLSSDRGDSFLVAADDTLAGYVITRTASDESELLNIAVAPAARGRGIGALLLDTAMDRAIAAGAAEMWLEVRVSNAAARALYETRGFSEVGVRKRYYESPREDALVLRADLRAAIRNKTVTRAGGSLTAAPVDSLLSPASHFSRQETK